MCTTEQTAPQYRYVYETHLHTSDGSFCSRISAVEQVRHYHALGYTGITVTDHFFSNGSCTVPRELPWEERVDLYYRPYEVAREEGEKLGLQVFFALEHSFHGNDFLVYGLTRDWMVAHPDFHLLEPLAFLQLVRHAGAVVIHAHPYRLASYIDYIRLMPEDVDGVEIYNACRDDRDNELARIYCEAYGLAPSAGSDNHRGEQTRYAGILSPRRFTSAEDMARAIVDREIKPVLFRSVEELGLT